MAIDRWNGTGNWATNPTFWSLGSPPSSTVYGEIQTGAATLTTTGSALTLLIDSGATFSLGNSVSLTTANWLWNVGAWNVTGNGDTVTLAGQFYNSGAADIGAVGLATSTKVSAAGVQNTGSITLQGNSASGATAQATLVETGVNPVWIAGEWGILGDADLQVTAAMTYIVTGAVLQIAGAEARVSIGSAATSTALSTLAINEGTLDLEGNTSFGAGGAALTTSTGFSNHGALLVDTESGSGASHLTLGGALLNTGTVTIGNVSQGANVAGATLATVASLYSTGVLDVQGNAASGTTKSATLNVTGASAAVSTGTVRVGGDGVLEFGSGGISTISSGSTIELDGALARITTGGTTTSALATLMTNNGTLNLQGNTFEGAGGAILTTTAGFNNNGTFDVDNGSSDGGSTATFGGTVSNRANMAIGNTNLGASTTVTATGLVNNASLAVQGNVGSGATQRATLHITGAALASVTGVVRVGGDGLLEFASGNVGSISSGSTLELDGAGAEITTGGTTTSALALLSSNNGTLNLQGNTFEGAGGANWTSTVGFTNNGALLVDTGSSDGGSTATIGGTLVNHATTTVGNTNLVASTTMHVAALSNSATLTVQGNAGGGASQQATLNVAGASAVTSTGVVRVGGDGLLEFGSGSITSIASGSTIELDGAEARITTGGTTTSALATLSVNNGSLLLQGGTFEGANGASLTTTTAFNNYGLLAIDVGSSDGGSHATFGGLLTNDVSLQIGNTNLAASTTVTATGLTNNGSLTVQGAAGVGATSQATLNIAGAAPSLTNGPIRVGGDALLEFGSGAITSIAGGSSLELDGAAKITTGGTSSSALAQLSINYGALTLQGDIFEGEGGASLTTTAAFTNDGALAIDAGSSDGGSNVAFGGLLTNNTSLQIGNTNLAASTTVTATALVDNGSLTLQGNAASGTTSQATLNIAGAAPSVTNGPMRVGGDALLEYGSGFLTTIAGGGSLELDGAQARITTGGTTTSALAHLAVNYGTLQLQGGTFEGAGGATLAVTTTTGFSNDGLFSIDTSNVGGSTATFAGKLTNDSTMNVGQQGSSGSTSITAASFVNNGSMALTGGSGSAKLTVNGAATNIGSLTINTNGEVDVTGSNSFTQSAGTTTVNGALVAATINANGGLVDFNEALTSGDGVGTLNVGSTGTLEFAAGVDSSHFASFTGATGTLELGNPGLYHGEIDGFTGNDAIDLINGGVTGLSYSGSTTSGVLTLTGSSGTVGTLAFNGNYTQSSFVLANDGRGGVDILHG
jgi:hypothetical protein